MLMVSVNVRTGEWRKPWVLSGPGPILGAFLEEGRVSHRGYAGIPFINPLLTVPLPFSLVTTGGRDRREVAHRAMTECLQPSPSCYR